MTRTRKRPAKPAGELYYKTPVTPEEAFQAIGRLRKEARDEIDRLIRFLDKTDDYVSRELEQEDGNDEEGGDAEPSLGSFDRLTNQADAWRQTWQPGIDYEQDNSDREPSLGSVGDMHHDQRGWAAGDRRDLERDGAESGIGDHDGLMEQVGTRDWQQGGQG